MLELDIAKELRRVKGNEPLLLDDSQMVWVVQSGTLALFATKVEEGEPKGNRRYLFSVSAGEALFGASLWEQWGILAVAIETTELSPLPMSDFADLVAVADNDAIAFLDCWLKHLGDFISSNQLQVPMNLEQIGKSRYFSLQKGHVLSSSAEQVVWVHLADSSVRWMGIEELRLEATSVVFPLASGMWLEAEDLVELHVHATAELENLEQIPTSLGRLHTYFFYYLNLLVIKKKEQEFRLFQERQQLNRQVTETALGELTTVLHPQKAAFFQEGTSLLIAAGAVGRAMGITIRPPAQSEDLSRVIDPLDAIARASQFRTRRVLLLGDWWREEHGPLLAYTESDKSPVALLPQGKSYILFDPVQRTQTLVTEAVAQTLSPSAQMFYRPLPILLHNATQLFQFGIGGHEKELVGVILLGMLGTLLGMVTPQATAILVNDAIPDSDRVQLLQIGMALFAAAVGQAAFQMSQGILTLRVENAADAALQPAVWDRLLSLKPAFFRSYSSGDLLTRLLAVTHIRSKLSGATQRTLLSSVFSLLNLGLMFVYSVQLALVGMGLTLVAAIATVTSSTLLVRKDRQQEAVDGEINGLTVELINGVSKLRVAAAEGRAFAAWAKKYSKRTKLKAGIKRIHDSVSVFNEALPLVSSVLLFWFAIMFMQMAQAKGGIVGLNMGTFLAFNAAFGTFLSGVTDLSNTLTDILGIVPLWERAKPIVQGSPESDLNKADPGRLTGKIALEHITFRYREDGPLILDDVSIYAEPGEFVAIVGPSGSGKSTVFRLLLGFETPLSGTVYYDGQDIAGLDIQAVRRQLGVVLQNGRINSGSLFENLTCGALVTMDEAWQAARMAGFAEDIEQMPMGMHTVISEGGMNLSGGQRQRLLISRSILLKPKIILMDEATSALDNRTQAIVTESLDKLNATRIVIAHRLSTIRNANRIYVIEAGHLVEVGSYAELVKQGGLFARLVARQLD